MDQRLKCQILNTGNTRRKYSSTPKNRGVGKEVQNRFLFAQELRRTIEKWHNKTKNILYIKVQLTCKLFFYIFLNGNMAVSWETHLFSQFFL